MLAPFHRLRGEALASRDTGQAEEAFRQSINIARDQGARTFELQAALLLARLYQSNNRSVEAHDVLAPALEGFSPTPELPAITEAEELLDELTTTKAVSAAIVHRQQRLELQTSYNRAVLFGKGFGSEDTRAAFARVSDLRGSTKRDARLPTFYGQCIASFFRGDFSVAQKMAEVFLREADAEARISDSIAVRRLLGIVLFFTGNLNEAGLLFERALADFDFERDGDVRFVDGFVGAAAVYASLLWHIGDVDRGRLLIQRALGRARELGHPATLAHVLTWNAHLEVRRGDASAALLAAREAIKVAEEFGMKHYADGGRVWASWADARLLGSDESATRFTLAMQVQLADSAKLDAPMFYGLLAEIEASLRDDPQSALAAVAQGIAISNETGGRHMDPYLYRLRGDLLLRRSPADDASAEDAYRAAIAAADQQGARTYALLASLSLGKMLCSIGRHAEASDLLAPALEGFSPTPELPRIAEAQALLAELTART